MQMTDKTLGDPVVFEDLFRQQGEAMRSLFAPLVPGAEGMSAEPADLQHWAMSAAKLQKMWLDFSAEQAGQIEPMFTRFGDIGKWTQTFMAMAGQMPIAQAETQTKLWNESMALWGAVMRQFVGSGVPEAPALPRKDRRFADKRWHEQPAFALIHQTYLLLAERLQQMAEETQGLSPDRKEQLRFATKVVTDALSPANFPLTNPVVIERTMETRGENLVKGVEHLLDDLRKGQLTHTDPNAFELGRNIAMTPGKVVHETPLFQLIQYSPTTDEVFETPLLIFPPWINRFYILDLNPQKSFIRWAVEQG
ncbi:MAG: class I poly(R)-hydroxyalkanoic acid synthase, partial [Novosphingobium sp. 35-62-5]